MDKDYSKAWTVVKETDGWYYYGSLGEPLGPFSSEDAAYDALGDTMSYIDAYYEETE